MAVPLIVQPQIATFLGNGICGFVLAFTPRNSLLRPALFPLVCMVAYEIFVLARKQDSPMKAVIAGGSVIAVILHYIEQIFLNQWTFEAQGPTSTRGGLTPALKKPLVKDTFWNRLCFALDMMFQNRYPNTQWAVKGIPAYDVKNPKAVPSGGVFLWWMTFETLLLLLFLDVNVLLPVDPHMEVTFGFDRIPFFARLDRMTSEEFGIRVAATISFLTFGRCTLSLLWHVLALLHVASGLATPAGYPPVYGRLADMWSIRQFWSSFWHQILRRKLSSPAHYITYELLGLKHGKLLSRYLFIFLTFFASGLLHQVADMCVGYSWSQSGALWFFGAQPLGILLEDGAIAAYRAVTGDRRTEGPVWAKLLGGVWVLAFLTVTLPYWIYPALRISEQGVLPFTILGRLVE